MNKKIECSVVLDLLPLYQDNVVGDETKAIINEHIKTCQCCKEEYELMAVELPELSNTTPKDSFLQVAKKQKQKRIIGIILTAVMSISLTLGGVYFVTQEPLKALDSNEIEVMEIYVVNTDDGPQVFMWHRTPIYSGKNSITWEVGSDKQGEYHITKRVPLISSPIKDVAIPTFVTTFPLENEDGNVEEIYYNDSLIWSLEKNGDDIEPEYVREYFNSQETRKTMLYDYEAGYFGMGYDEENMSYWDLEGNVIKR